MSDSKQKVKFQMRENTIEEKHSMRKERKKKMEEDPKENEMRGNKVKKRKGT